MSYIWRVLLIALIIWLLYRLVINWFKKPDKEQDGATKPNSPHAMVQDPVCKVYLPRRQALELKRDGQEYYFCSEQCREKFQDEYQ